MRSRVLGPTTEPGQHVRPSGEEQRGFRVSISEPPEEAG